MSVHLDGSAVVLTLTRQRARALASSIARRGGDEAHWMDEMGRMLSVAGAQLEYTDAVPRLARGTFLRGLWDKADVQGTRPALGAPTAPVRISGTVVTSAAAAVAEAMAITGEAETEVTAEFVADQATQAVVLTQDAVDTAADKAASAAHLASAGRAQATAAAAQAIAETAAETADVVRMRADASASRVASAASEAAETLAASASTVNDEDAAVAASRLAATVIAAAVAKAEETALAAAEVARGVAEAATKAATAATLAAKAFEAEVAKAAAAVQNVAVATARRVAVETRQKAIQVAKSTDPIDQGRMIEDRFDEPRGALTQIDAGPVVAEVTARPTAILPEQALAE